MWKYAFDWENGRNISSLLLDRVDGEFLWELIFGAILLWEIISGQILGTENFASATDKNSVILCSRQIVRRLEFSTLDINIQCTTRCNTIKLWLVMVMARTVHLHFHNILVIQQGYFVYSLQYQGKNCGTLVSVKVFLIKTRLWTIHYRYLISNTF